MFEIFRECTFSASHQLRGYKGRCERLHGHNWRVRVYLQSKELNELGMVLDFHELDDFLQEAISKFDHQHLNEVEPFTSINPSSENLSKEIFERIQNKLTDDRVKIVRCDVWENEKSCARYKI